MSAWDPLRKHRGPYLLQVSRPKTPTKSKPAFYATETLGTRFKTRDDVLDEVALLLGDPRDTIDAVHVWSAREQQHIATYRRSVVVVPVRRTRKAVR